MHPLYSFFFILFFLAANMGKTQEETMSNPFIPKDVKLHALTRAEEENCFKELKANALEACQVPIKGINCVPQFTRNLTFLVYRFCRL